MKIIFNNDDLLENLEININDKYIKSIIKRLGFNGIFIYGQSRFEDDIEIVTKKDIDSSNLTRLGNVLSKYHTTHWSMAETMTYLVYKNTYKKGYLGIGLNKNYRETIWKFSTNGGNKKAYRWAIDLAKKVVDLLEKEIPDAAYFNDKKQITLLMLTFLNVLNLNK